ncbi:MAG: type II secretion system protein [Geobacteraceae bacterium GWC2_55_20]|nr:MAG: type II secretion system protein [Geobacteraceae bacterium GWC2_55_20]HBA70952.1 type II secretion system protein [Geobacter sp.]HCE66921.1 type II secretion system protein [Geobacter sp.]
MRYLNLTISILLLAAISLLSGCSAGTKAFSKGQDFETQGKFEEAMYSYAEAFRNDPTMNEYRLRFLKVREKAADQRFKQGVAFAEKGNYIDALTEYQAAQGLDPSQGRFKQKIDSTTLLKDAQVAFLEGRDFEKTNKLKDAYRLYSRALELSPKNSEYQEALSRVTGMRKSKLEGKELSLKSSKPITLKFKDAKMKDVFNILTQLSGINFIFDEGVKDTPVSIYLENASFQQAFDLLTNMNKLDRKILNETTVLVYPRTPDKIKQYEDMVLRTFHLNYMDAKKAINLIRTMIQVKKAYVNEDSNSIVVRDSADIVAVVEKILDANDMPEAEVVLDVEVIEMSDKNAQNVGLLLSNYNVQLGAFSPTNSKLMATTLTSATTTSSTTATTTDTSATIDNLLRVFTLKGYGGFVTVPNATYNLGKTLAKGEVLSNPKIRVKNKEKSKFNVGTRVPITTTTLNGTLSQVNVQYVDVGVKVNAEPTIQLNNEITIKLSLEVSSILTKEKIGDASSLTTVVTIGTRNVETVLTLKDGETSIIGGLIQNTSNNDKTKIFLLGDIPLIGPLLSNSNTSKDKTELLLAITPRLVRGVSVPAPGLASFVSGKEDDPSLVRPMASFDLEAVFDDASKPKTQPKAADKKPAVPAAKTAPAIPATATRPVAPQATVPAVAPAVPGAKTESTAPAVSPAAAKTADGAVPASVPTPATAAAPAKAAVPAPAPVTAPAAPVPAQRALLQIAAPASSSIGQQFGIDIKVTGVTDLANASLVLTYDPIFVEFISMTEGPFLKKDGKPTSFSSKADTAGGAVSVSLLRVSGSGGVSGGGVMATAMFRAKNQGPASFAFRNVAFSTANGAAQNILPFSTAVDVR